VTPLACIDVFGIKYAVASFCRTLVRTFFAVAQLYQMEPRSLGFPSFILCPTVSFFRRMGR